MEMQGLRPGTSDSIVLRSQRDRLDIINNEVVDLLAERMRVCMEIADLKALHNIPMMQPERIAYVLESLKNKSVKTGLRSEFIESIFRLIIRETCIQEDAAINQRVKDGQPS